MHEAVTRQESEDVTKCHTFDEIPILDCRFSIDGPDPLRAGDTRQGAVAALREAVQGKFVRATKLKAGTMARCRRPTRDVPPPHTRVYTGVRMLEKRLKSRHFWPLFSIYGAAIGLGISIGKLFQNQEIGADVCLPGPSRNRVA
jgi:hypothetical protein